MVSRQFSVPAKVRTRAQNGTTTLVDQRIAESPLLLDALIKLYEEALERGLEAAGTATECRSVADDLERLSDSAA